MTGVEYWYFQEVTFIFEMYLVLWIHPTPLSSVSPNDSPYNAFINLPLLYSFRTAPQGVAFYFYFVTVIKMGFDGEDSHASF